VRCSEEHRVPLAACANWTRALSITIDEIISKIADIMSDVFDVDDVDVNATTSADDIDEWDSLSHIRFIITLERQFKIKFRNEEIADLKNVGDLARVIQSKLAA
jgi:acyl carrier protein